MAKPRGVEAKLARLRALGHEAAVPEHLGDLRQALADKSNLVVAAAAEIAGKRVLSDLAPDLVAAFHRFMIDPEATDKLCRAKLAIVESLNQIEYDKDDVFLLALRHVQTEPRWGGSEDVAASLRGNGAFGLVRVGYPGLALLLVELLADPEKIARSAAAQALGETRASAAIPLLRFKARVGDQEPEVIGACLAALMSADAKESLPFVAEFLEVTSRPIQEAAAFALAESRRPEALDVLKAYWPNARRGALQEVILLAIATTRLPAAVDFLLEIVAGEHVTAASAALVALAIHRHNEPIMERIAAVLAGRGDASLLETFKKKLASKA